MGELPIVPNYLNVHKCLQALLLNSTGCICFMYVPCAVVRESVQSQISKVAAVLLLWEVEWAGEELSHSSAF